MIRIRLQVSVARASLLMKNNCLEQYEKEDNTTLSSFYIITATIMMIQLQLHSVVLQTSIMIIVLNLLYIFYLE